MNKQNDDYLIVNPILRSIMRNIYNSRDCFPVRYLADARVERVNDEYSSVLFFLSRGCTHDRNGGCTMCNYGYGKEYTVNYEKMLAEVQKTVNNLPSHLKELGIVPIGSILDEREVPTVILDRILAIVSGISVDEITIETRADTINQQSLRHLYNRLRNKKITIEIGLETEREWCLRNCVNKNISIQQVQDAIHLIHTEGMGVCVNVGLGFPFVSDKYSVNSAVDSIKTMFRLDVERIALFAYNIRPGTLLEWLWRNGLYNCISLWSLPEVLSHFSDAELHHIEISWYKNFYQDNKKILQMPYLCDECNEDVQVLLDGYRNHPCCTSLKSLLNYDCSCKQKWKTELASQKDCVDWERVKKSYRFMADKFGISKESVETELYYMEQTCLLKG